MRTITALQIYEPVEILFPATMLEQGNVSTLFALIRQQFPNIDLVSVKRKYFNESKGRMGRGRGRGGMIRDQVAVSAVSLFRRAGVHSPSLCGRLQGCRA